MILVYRSTVITRNNLTVLLLLLFPMATRCRPDSDKEMTHVLKNRNIEIRIDLPLRNYSSSRFDWTGKIVSVKYRNKLITTSERLNEKEDNKHGKGFYNEFGIDAALGYNETKVGEWFHKIGVGLLRKEQGEYLFSRNYEVRPARFDVFTGQDKVIIRCTSQTENGYSYILTKEIVLSGAGFVIRYRLKNTGTKTICSNEYVHSFLSVNQEFTGSDYILKFPFSIKPEHFDFSVNPEEKVVLGRKEITFNGTPGEQFFFSNLTGGECVNAGWELLNIKEKTGVKEAGSFKTTRVNLWGWKHVISPELFFEIRVEPGRETGWTRTFTVFETK